ncbi:MAG: thioesterase family protein [Alphaproteobacteria bacterium]
MIDSFRGYVNTWECDDVGHMNVQFYIARFAQAQGVLNVALGLGARSARTTGLSLVPLEDHVHFRNELRVADTMTVASGIKDLSTDHLTVFHEMREAVSGTVAATALTRLALTRTGDAAPVPLPDTLINRAAVLTVSVPETAGPRSVGAVHPPLPALTFDEARSRGLIHAYSGIVDPKDCAADGRLLPQGFMARHSDGGGHLWAGVGMDRRRLIDQGIGIALVEYQQLYLTLPPAGTALSLMSGITNVGRKTVSFAHFIFDAETGAPLGRAEATALLLDLKARRSADLTPQDRDRLMKVKAGQALRP